MSLDFFARDNASFVMQEWRDYLNRHMLDVHNTRHQPGIVIVTLADARTYQEIGECRLHLPGTPSDSVVETVLYCYDRETIRDHNSCMLSKFEEDHPHNGQFLLTVAANCHNWTQDSHWLRSVSRVAQLPENYLPYGWDTDYNGNLVATHCIDCWRCQLRFSRRDRAEPSPAPSP